MWEWYALIRVTAFCGLCQVLCLNHSIQNNRVSIAIPIYASTLIILGTASGMLLYEEYDDMGHDHIGLVGDWLLFTGGILVAVAGVLLMGSRTTEDVVHDVDMSTTAEDSYSAETRIVENDSSQCPGPSESASSLHDAAQHRSVDIEMQTATCTAVVDGVGPADDLADTLNEDMSVQSDVSAVEGTVS